MRNIDKCKMENAKCKIVRAVLAKQRGLFWSFEFWYLVLFMISDFTGVKDND